MNLLKYQVEDKVEKVGDELHMLVKDFRKYDLNKIDTIIQDMLNKAHQLDERYEGTLSSEIMIPDYLNLNTSYYKKYVITQRFKNEGEEDFQNEIEFIAPLLRDDNYFILNNMVYVPLLFLEKAPIDRIYQPSEKKNRIFINLNPVYNFTFDLLEKKKGLVKFKNRSITVNDFLRVFFAYDRDYLEFLKENGYIDSTEITEADRTRFIKFLNFHKVNFFDGKDLAQWINDFLFLDYYKEIFKNYFGSDDIRDIVKLIIDMDINKIEINMADLRNRRVVLMEYLFKPVFDIYVRLIYGIIDKNNQNFLPSMNSNSIITKGFNSNLHRGNLYDYSLPFPLPLINKVSQDISIINDGRLPKSWTENNPSGYKVLCPISVSAQNTALALIFTSSTKLNQYGKIILEEHL